MKWNIKIILFLFVLCIGQQTLAQYFSENENYFQKLTIESGLSQNKVNCILRDQTGFVWFGTGNGLNRFDGKNIVLIEKDFGDEYNLKDIEIFDLHEDKDGIIWIASEKGLFEYIPEIESFKRFLLSGDLHREPAIKSIGHGNDSIFWLGTDNGLKIFDKKLGLVQGEFTNKPYDPYSLSSNNIYTVCDCGQKVWVGTSEGVSVLDKKSGLFKRYFHDVNKANSLGNNVVRKIVRDKEGVIWLGTEFGGLSYYNKETNSFSTFNTKNSTIPHDDIRDIFDLGNGTMWLATNGGGLTRFTIDQGDFQTYSYASQNINGLSNNSVYSVIEDYEGILWLGFYAGGVNFRTSKINEFKIVTHLPGNKNSICESNVRSLYLDSDTDLWIGTFEGLSLFNRATRNYKAFISNPLDTKTLSFNKITSIFKDSQDNTWVGTYSGGINLLKPNASKFIHFRHNAVDANSISSDNIYSIVEDADNNIWVATSAGLNLFKRDDNNWERIFNIDIRDIVFGEGSKMYLTEYGGIIEYDYQSGIFENYDNENFSSSLVVVLLNDGNKIWFGTQGHGFGCLDLETKEFTNYGTKDGLPSNFISSIVANDANSLWISTYKGLSLFNKQTKRFVNYGMAEGVPFLEFYPKSSVVLPDSTIAFGGSNGMVVFDPQKVICSKQVSRLQFSNFRIDGNKVDIGQNNSPLNKNINLVDEITLKYGQNDFSFDFVDINFKNRGLGDFAYKLENYMNDWSYIGNQNSVGFTNMDPGKYVLKIRKLGGNLEVGYQDEIEMHITIVPPFWMTWYFYLIVFVIIVGIMVLYNQYTFISISQKNKIRLKNLEYEKHEEFNKLRMKFFTYISHELRTPLSLIVDPLSRLQQLNIGNENQKYLELIENNAERLKRLVNQILDFRKLENDALKLKVSKKNITDEVSTIYTSFVETANSESIKYKFESTIDANFEGWIDSDKLEKIMYNLLSNAFKFTKENGLVLVGLSKSDDNSKIVVSIIDNGFGMRPDKLKYIFEYFYSDDKHARNYKSGVGIGLTYVKRLTDLHHGSITAESEIEKGTSFRITFPVNVEAYTEDEIRDVETPKEQTKFKVENTFKRDVNTAPAKHGKGVPLVLVVEDEPELREYLAFRLEEKFRVVTAINGKDALAKINSNLPDLILSDNVMPVMDGIALCNEIKGNAEYSHIPFIFLSAWNSDDFKLKGLKVGAEDYLSKPFNYEIIEAIVSNVIGTRKALLEVAGQMVKVKPGKIKIETSDEKFILKAQEVIERNIDKLNFSTKQFEEELSMSHSVVYRKIKTLTGLSANEFIREFKIRRAAQIILQDQNLSMMDISLMVGFNDQKYFSRCFKKVMEVTPSEYASQKK